MYDTRKFIYLALIFLVCNNLSSQKLIQNSKFSNVPMFDGKVVFIKEIPLKSINTNHNFSILKNWGQINFGNDPLVSSVLARSKEKKIYCASKIELLLPKNKQNVREKVIMDYKLDAFLLNNKCIFEIKDITYSVQKSKNTDLLKTNFSAEEMISDNAMQINDNLKELRSNTRAATLYFFNQLADNLEMNLKL